MHPVSCSLEVTAFLSFALLSNPSYTHTHTHTHTSGTDISYTLETWADVSLLSTFCVFSVQSCCSSRRRDLTLTEDDQTPLSLTATVC